MKPYDKRLPDAQRRERVESTIKEAGLTDEQVWALVSSVADDNWLHEWALIAPMTVERRFALASRVRDEFVRYMCATDIKELTGEQRWELVKGIEDDIYREWASANVPGLMPDQRLELMEPIQQKGNQ
jgi:hypothetical protein